MKHCVFAILVLLFCLGLVCCSGGDGDDASADTDADGDADADGDSDTDADITGNGPKACDVPDLSPGQYTRTIEFAGRTRNYQLHVPQGYDGTAKVPLVFDLHPVATNAAIMELMTIFRPKSDQEGFILVQPNGVSGSWNGGPKCCGTAEAQKLDDVGLIRAIRDQVAAELCVDLTRVYADGMSNGGYLAHRIACEDSDLLAAIGGVVSSIGFDNLDECQPSRPVPVVMISGGADSAADRDKTFQKWVTLNGCSEAFTTEEIGVFTCTTYDDCDGDVETTHCVGKGVGHCWPGTPFQIYPCNRSLGATDYLWNFFQKFTIPEPA
jgi:polyhydroxybutyrate depolymerase